MCAFGMYQDTEEGRKLVLKPTGFMTNAKEIGNELNKRCEGNHSHVTLVNGRAKKAQVYPDELCFVIITGLLRQMKRDGRLSEGGIGMVMAEDEAQAWDDTTGEELNAGMVREARMEEIREINKHEVYYKVPVQMSWDKTGKAPIKARWLDINKGDKVHPNYRSRYVAKDFNNEKRLDLFAATPPLEALKILISLWMTQGIGWGTEKGEMVTDFIDVRRAYFHARARRDVFVELPDEDSEPGMCGKLIKSLYGTRDAAQNWEEEYIGFMNDIGFDSGKASPCLFHHADREIRAVVHGDDFTLLGHRDDLDWF